MIFPTYFLTLLPLLLTSVVAAPIGIPSDALAAHPQYAGHNRHSSVSSGHHQHHDHALLSKSDSQEAHLIPYEELESPDVHETELYDPTETEAYNDQGTEASDMTENESSNVPGDQISEGLENQAAAVMMRRSIFSKIRNGFRKVGSSIKKGVQRAVQKATSGIRNAANKVKNGVKKVAGKAKAFLKENGAKIAKVGLKGIATYYKLASHAAAFIPVIGKPLGKALSVASKAADFGSDQIHANLDGKWGKAASVMNTIQHPVGGVAGKVLDSVLKRDLEYAQIFERDLPETLELF